MVNFLTSDRLNTTIEVKLSGLGKHKHLNTAMRPLLLIIITGYNNQDYKGFKYFSDRNLQTFISEEFNHSGAPRPTPDSSLVQTIAGKKINHRR